MTSIFPRVKYQLTQPCLFEQQLTDKRESEARQTMKVKVKKRKRPHLSPLTSITATWRLQIVFLTAFKILQVS